MDKVCETDQFEDIDNNNKNNRFLCENNKCCLKKRRRKLGWVKMVKKQTIYYNW